MLVFAFFTAVFSSVSWFIYSVLFIREKTVGMSLLEQSPADLLILTALLFLPLLVIWMVFGYVNQFVVNRAMNKKQNVLLNQLQKNQDYTDLVVRVMLDAEHEIKDGFVINKFDVLIGDMNEALAEIIQRCNIASSAQMDALWQRVKRGEKWSLGKAILEASKNQSTFDAWVREKVSRDKVFRGSLLEFCSRYQNLLQLLEKHDRDRIFLHIIETGVFGKVYSIIAPMTEGIKIDANERIYTASSTENDYTSALKLATMEDPEAHDTIVNVDKNDEEYETISDKISDKLAIFKKLNPFTRVEKEEYNDEDSDIKDPFFKALHNSFQNDKDNVFLDENDFVSSIKFNEEKSDEAAELSAKSESVDFTSPFYRTTSLSDEVNKTRSISDDNDYFINKEPSFDKDLPETSANNYDNAAISDKQNNVENRENNEENLVYPFGGWTDEDKYTK